MPNYQGVWSLSTQFQNATEWQGDNVPPVLPRALFAGGDNGSYVSEIDQVEIATTGNATDYGDLTSERSTLISGFGSSTTRGLVGGGRTTSTNPVNLIDYFAFASTGSGSDFGDLTEARTNTSGASNSTRALFCCGNNGGTYLDTVDYVTIATLGNAVDFGNASTGKFGTSSTSSSTRLIVSGGYSITEGYSNTIDYFTISSAGNWTDFGNLTNVVTKTGSCSNGVRAVIAGGTTNSPSFGRTNVIAYVTLATTGNATDFGDQTIAREAMGTCSSAVRGIFGGGRDAGGRSNVIDYITLASTGNATDFGDLTQAKTELAGCSNDHGGLQ